MVGLDSLKCVFVKSFSVIVLAAVLKIYSVFKKVNRALKVLKGDKLVSNMPH